MKFDYSTRARRIALRHPLLSDILTQIAFWILAYLLFFVLVNFISKAVASLFNPKAVVHISENILIGIIAAVILGTFFGLIDHFVGKWYNKKSLGIEIFIKSILYLIVWFSVVNITRAIGLALEAKFIDNTTIGYSQNFFSNIGTSSTIYTIVMILVISFIKQMNNKFGPGVLLPMLLGKYRKPRVEERIFMFMDLKSSTTYAEKLGHIKYSEMIQTCFLDLNKVIPKYYAEVYQYVGDEVVLTWTKDQGLEKFNCFKLYFAFKEELEKNKEYYIKNFGLLPEFKASVNIGEITVAEVGDIKREIAYHGDTINTAARIQEMCNMYKSSFLISEALNEYVKKSELFSTTFLDEKLLKGKTKLVKLFSVTKSSTLQN
jgi:adenylate cyclase